MTDELLMQAVRDGDLARLGTLFERHHLAVFDFLARMTGDRAAAEDLTQDVFVRILKYRATFRNEGSFQTWLFRIARNARADYFKRRGGVEHISDEGIDPPADTPGPARLLEQGQDAARLRQALLRLREDRRELIVLARYRGMTHEEIAELLGVDPGAVKVRFHRAIKELREIYLSLENHPWTAQPSPRTLRII
jgi:RNA polymerase sigma factor (sigma-70 family)